MAVEAKVGGGVSEGGGGVKVGISVGGSTGIVVAGMGWKGVGVGDAFGATVTSTTVGGIGAAGAIPQEERIMTQRMIKM